MIQLSRWKVILLSVSLVLGLLFAFPNVLSSDQRAALPGFVPKGALNLGLDLQGGSYLLLEVDTDAMRVKRVDNLVEDVRVTLREAQININALQREQGGVIISLASADQANAAFTALRTLAGGANQQGVQERAVTRMGGDRIRTDQAHEVGGGAEHPALEPHRQSDRQPEQP